MCAPLSTPACALELLRPCTTCAVQVACGKLSFDKLHGMRDGPAAVRANFVGHMPTPREQCMYCREGAP